MKRLKKGLLSVLLCIFGAVVALGAVACGKKNNTPAKDPNLCTVTFELCTPEGLTTNVVAPKEVKKGSTVTKPIVAVLSDNPNNSEVDSWYTDKEYTNKWNFLTSKVESDMTLYAKWVDNHVVTYYLGLDATTPMFQEHYRDGAPLKVMQELSDGYRCNGFFYKDGTEVVDGVSVNGPLDIYIDRSEEIYFSASMIANRFTPVASGGPGSTAGTMTLEGEGEEAYAKANFGYSTDPGDAYMHLKNVTLDITASQKLRITFKNLGKAENLKFYFVIWYEDNTPVDQNYFTEATTCVYTYKPEEIEMSPESEWAVAEIDVAGQNVSNGVSLWGNAATLVQVRMQSTYVSENKEDLSNEIWIKSIEGIKDSTNVGTEDTEEVQNLQKNDDAAALEDAASKQEAVSGWVFPKDFNDASVVVKTDEEGNELEPEVNIYNKVNGLLMSSKYRAKEASVKLTVPEGKVIDLDQLTTIRLRLKNLGYAGSLSIKYETSYGRTGERTVTIDSRMNNVEEYIINMFNAGSKYTGTLASLTLTYTSVGNDNAILVDSVIFDEFIPLYISGLNFNDKTAYGIESTDVLKAAYDQKKDATKITVLQSGASFEKSYNCYSILGYKGLELQYILDEKYEDENGDNLANGITKALLQMTVDGVVYDYEFLLETSRSKQTIALPLKASGYLEKIQFTFEGTGVIFLQELRFTLDVNSAVDFGTSAVFSMMLTDWKATLSYNEDMSAVLYNSTASKSSFNWYIGYMMNATNVPNIPLINKSKVVIIYQNPNNGGYIHLSLGHVDDRLPEFAGDKYQTEFRYPGGSGGSISLTGLKTNMAQNEWASTELDLTEMFLNGDGTAKVTYEDLEHLYLSTIFVTPSVSMYIRAIIVMEAEGEYVSFETNAPEGVEVEEIGQQFVRAGEMVRKPSVNVTNNASGMQIIGWYTDAACTQAWDFNSEVSEEMTLYAKWGITHTVNYYLDGNLIASQYYENGVALAPEINVVGHKVIGYYDANGNEVAVGSAVTADMELTVKRSENLYFDANALKNTFVPVASNAGSDGSTAGLITVKGEGAEQYAEVNFGYAKSVADPHIIASGLNIDITKSQTLRFTMKNLGGANKLKFYFLVADESGNVVGSPTINEVAAFVYDFTADQMNMNAMEEWLTIDIDISSVNLSGVSLWGTAKTLKTLRIQSQYVSKNPNDLSNVLLIKSIEGIANEAYTTTNDKFVGGFLANDSETDVNNAASAQTAISGFIFPKDNASATANGITLYNKVNGLLLYTPYMGAGSVTFTVADGKTISLDHLTTLVFNLRNYGYATNLVLSWENTDGLVGTRALTISERMDIAKAFELNMAGYENYVGNLKSFTISYSSVGIDNAIMLESIAFNEFKAETLVGFNLNDKDLDIAGNAGVEVAYDGAKQSTKFTVITDGASVEKVVGYQFSVLGYGAINLSYAMATEGVTAIKVTLTTDGVATTYTYNVAKTEEVATLTQALTVSGKVEKIAISFVGSGEIHIASITFSVVDGVDFSVELKYTDYADWMQTATYDADLKATNKAKAGIFKFYTGLLKAWATTGKETLPSGNISLEGKSQIVIIYQNRNAAFDVHVGIGIVDKSGANWQNATAEGGTGGYQLVKMQGNMAANEWAAATIDISALSGITDANKANKAFASLTMNMDQTFYIRAITVI